MNVLLLSPYEETGVAAALRATGDSVIQTMEPVNAATVDGRVDFLVSYGYTHIIRQPVLDLLGDRAVNLHIAYLPWNRGAHPNLWSVVDGTPAGVTIHVIDAGIDTGAILAQRLVDLAPEDTLATSYGKLRRAIEGLFAETWPDLRAGRLAPRPQDPAHGSLHRRRDLDRVWPHLAEGWDTPLSNVPRAADLAPQDERMRSE